MGPPFQLILVPDPGPMNIFRDSIHRLETFFANRRFKSERKVGEECWQMRHLATAEACGQAISKAIENGTPHLIGKLGHNELKLVKWAAGIAVNYGRMNWPTFWHETKGCELNAGARPRTKASYRELATLFEKSLHAADLLGVFKLASEINVVDQFCDPAIVAHHLSLTPFFNSDPWTRHLAGKRVFVVSPFVESFQNQHKRAEQIWPLTPDLLPDFEMIPYRFPYLIEPDCKLTWQDVYRDVCQEMENSEFDVALFGCGALGFPLAAKAKALNKIGIHLGGTTQVLFGVKGRRFELQQKFARLINDAWIYPTASETSRSAENVEQGCYWGPTQTFKQ